MPKRIDPKIEAFIQSVVDDYYLTLENPSRQRIIEDIFGRCRDADLKPPHSNTIRARIKAAGRKKALERREGGRAAQRYANE